MSKHQYTLEAQIERLRIELSECRNIRDRNDMTLVRLVEVYPEIKQFLESTKTPSRKNVKGLNLDVERARVIMDAANVNTVMHENEQLKQKYLRAQKQYQEFLSAANAVDEQNTKLLEEIKTTKQQLSESTAKLTEQLTERKALDVSIEKLREENAELNTQVKAKRQTSDERKEADVKLKKEVAEWKGIAEQCGQVNQELTSANRKLNTQLNTQLRDQRKTTVVHQTQNIAIAHGPTTECKKLLEEKQRLKAQVHEQEKHIKRLKGQVEELKQQQKQQNPVRPSMQDELQEAARIRELEELKQDLELEELKQDLDQEKLKQDAEAAKIKELEAKLERCNARHKIVGTVSRKRTERKGIKKHLEAIKEHVKAKFRTDEQHQKEVAKNAYRKTYNDSDARAAARKRAFGENRSTSSTPIIDRIKRIRKPLTEEELQQKQRRDQYRKIKKSDRYWERMLS